ncbi:hypothetical protein RvY_02390-2 [Ramazzottius varieornatus]|uniref:UNC93-like protein MFSD11 n=1 Tax=Ramazzottius varieornatus TaxID=947166 RepID=A0A1D1UU36_RAMVA|nr:hypothetical protein RvY_02390-2 [Ramazzottius varieornatus]
MVIGSLCICFYVGTYIRPLTIPLYFGSALFGLGLGALWTVQGYFITVNSLPKDVLRNTGIFLALYQSSLTSASLFYFLMVRGSLSITWETRIVVFSSLLAISFVGVIAFSLVVHPWTGKIPLGPETIISERREQPSVGSDHTRGSRSPDEHPKTAETHRRPWSAFLSTVKFIWTRNILMLTPYFIYIGFEQSMWSNIYPTALGYTVRFGILREAMVGLNGLFVGLGEILGGVFLGLMGTRLNAFGKDGALLGGLVVHLLACYMAFINTPVSASRGMTEYPAFVGPRYPNVSTRI